MGGSIVLLREELVVPDMLRAGGIAVMAESSFSVVVPRAETIRSVCAGAGEGAGALILVTAFGLGVMSSATARLEAGVGALAVDFDFDVLVSATERLGVGEGAGVEDFAVALVLEEELSVPLDLEGESSATARLGVGEGAGVEDLAVAFFGEALSAVVLVGAGVVSGAEALAVAFVLAEGVASGAGALATEDRFFPEAAGAGSGSISRGFGAFERKPIFADGAGAGVVAGLAATLAGMRAFSHCARFSASDRAPAPVEGAVCCANDAVTAIKTASPHTGWKN